MFTSVLKSYNEMNYFIKPRPDVAYACECIRRDGKVLQVGGGMPHTDILFLLCMKQYFAPKSIFVIGNSFGYSTLLLAELFPNITIDVIDAECEGAHNAEGSRITREIISRKYPNVQLTKGFSPQDLHTAMREKKYDFFFIDGYHENEQFKKDFIGCSTYASDNCVIYMHDVDFFAANMHAGYHFLINQFGGYTFFDVPFTAVGSKCAVKNVPQMSEWLQTLNENTNIPITDRGIW